MTYSNSTKAVDKVSALLDTIATTNGDSVSWTTSNSNNLGYQIRQALSICASNPTRYPSWCKLKDVWRIKVYGNKVTAVRATPLAELQTTVINATNFAKTVSDFEALDIKDYLSVVGVLIDNPNFEKYSFPDYTEVSNSDLSNLYKWTSKRSLYIINSKHLIITRKEPTEGIQWVPKLQAM